jgi:hypothetical protein
MARTGIDAVHRKVIFASSLGTVFEWYDFYLYGTLAVFFSALFFPPGNETRLSREPRHLRRRLRRASARRARVRAASATSSAGKYTFLITIVGHGPLDALVGVLPTYAQIGIWAPVLLVSLRLAQASALGGEYGGAGDLRRRNTRRAASAAITRAGSRPRRRSDSSSRSR